MREIERERRGLAPSVEVEEEEGARSPVFGGRLGSTLSQSKSRFAAPRNVEKDPKKTLIDCT